jgi:hypothetical protein
MFNSVIGIFVPVTPSYTSVAATDEVLVLLLLLLLLLLRLLSLVQVVSVHCATMTTATATSVVSLQQSVKGFRVPADVATDVITITDLTVGKDVVQVEAVDALPMRARARCAPLPLLLLLLLLSHARSQITDAVLQCSVVE